VNLLETFPIKEEEEELSSLGIIPEPEEKLLKIM
jgi:hypothetical protein